MKNHDNLNENGLIDDFRGVETLRSASHEQINYAHQMERANRELEAFAFTVSHDLRSPLSNISLCAQAVLRHCGNNLDEQCQSYLLSIFNQTEYMNQLLNGLIEFSRTSCKEIQNEIVDLSGIANTIAVNLKLNNPERSAVFSIKPKIEVCGDRCLLQKVLEILIGNAWKYSGTKESSVIEFGTKKIDGNRIYFVRDNGTGFDMSQAPKLFRQRLHCKEERSGIGLASFNQIIQRHGGEVWAEGKSGIGATFYFTLDRPPS